MALSLTDKEQKLLSNVFQCLQGGKDALPKVDLTKLVELGGFKNNNSANAVWYSLRKKLGLVGGAKESTTALNLTEADQKLLLNVFQCFKDDFKVDLPKLVKLGGYKNTNSANAVWYSLKQKLSGLGRDSRGNGASEETPKLKGRGRKRGAAEVKVKDGEGGQHEAVEPAPKKNRSKKVKFEPVEETAEVANGDANPFDSPAPMRKRYRSSKAVGKDSRKVTEGAASSKGVATRGEPRSEMAEAGVEGAQAAAEEEEEFYDAAAMVKAEPGEEDATTALLAEVQAAAKQCGKAAA